MTQKFGYWITRVTQQKEKVYITIEAENKQQADLAIQCSAFSFNELDINKEDNFTQYTLEHIEENLNNDIIINIINTAKEEILSGESLSNDYFKIEDSETL